MYFINDECHLKELDTAISLTDHSMMGTTIKNNQLLQAIDKNSKYSIHDYLKEEQKKIDHYVSIKSRHIQVKARRNESNKQNFSKIDSDEDYIDH